MKVLITDYAWADLEEERAIFDGVGASMVIATAGDEPELVQLAGGVDGILTCWKPVTAHVMREAPRCVAVGKEKRFDLAVILRVKDRACCI